MCTLRDVYSFVDIFPSPLLPIVRPNLKTCTIIVNADYNTERFSHCLAILLTPRSSSAYHFDSYGIVPLVPSIQSFIRQNCTTCAYNWKQLQCLTSDFCGQHCRLSSSTWTGVTPFSNSSQLFAVRGNADRHVYQMFESEFGATKPRGGWGQCCRICI